MRRVLPNFATMSGIKSRFTPILPKNDELEHRGLVLDNGMTVLLVSNPKEKEIASVALAVARGHMSDPKEVPGMAHFCEHMLFLGNEAYPVEGEYKQYLRQHGGGANAYTSTTTTCYYFHVVSDYLEGAVDRFLNFFVSPLFTEDATLRELNAIESEYHKNLLGDSKRSYYLMKHLSNHEHDFSKFGSGNLHTLLDTPKEKGIDIREKLSAFYAENYSADIMSLVMRSDHSLDEMESWVLKGFTKVTSKGLQKKVDWEGSHFTPSELGKIAYYLPIGKKKSMNVRFPYSKIVPEKQRNSRVLTHVLGHEGKGSLCMYLRDKGWISGLTTSETIIDNFGHFSVSFTLTDEGHGRPFEVLAELFSFIEMMKGNMDEAKRVWEEERHVAQLKFDTSSKIRSSACASAYAAKLRHSDEPEEFLSGKQLLGELNVDDLKERLGDLEAKNMLVMIADEHPEEHAELQTEPWWGVKYSLKDITDAEYSQAATRCDVGRYTLPPPLKFLPETTEVYEGENPTADPEYLVEVEESTKGLVTTCWKQAAFNTPMMYLKMDMESPDITSTPFGQAATVFVSKILSIDLSEQFYELEDVNPWHFSYSLLYGYFSIFVTGYDDKMHAITEALLKAILTMDIKEATFNMVKEQRIREIEARNTKNPLELGATHLSQVINTVIPPYAETDKEVRNMTWEAVVKFFEDVKKSCNMKVIAIGNKQREASSDIAKNLAATLRAHNYGRDTNAPHCEIPIPHRVALPETPLAEHRILEHTPNPTNLDSSLILHYQLGPYTYQMSAHMEVLHQIISPRFFTSLRTKQQLGYIVSVSSACSFGVLSLNFKVQSGVQPPSVLHERVDAFLKETEEELRGFSENDLKEVISSAKQKLLVPPGNLGQLYSEIREKVLHGLGWDKEKRIVAELEKVTKEGLVEFYHTHIRPESWTDPCKRKVVSVYNFSDAHAETDMPGLQASVTRQLDDVEASIVHVDAQNPQVWKASMPLHPKDIKC